MLPSCSLTTKTHHKRRALKAAAEGWSGPYPTSAGVGPRWNAGKDAKQLTGR